eukprot:UN12172
MVSVMDHEGYTWVKLLINCPACEESEHNETTQWKHKDCGEYVYVNEKAYIRCAESDHKAHPLMDWRWYCGKNTRRLMKQALKNLQLL